jgi:hypothetical protein
MRAHSAYVTVALGAASAVLCFAAAVAIPAIPGPKPAASVEPRVSDTVNRELKGDRLRIIVRPPDAAPFEVKGPAGSSPKLLDGCESSFSQMDHSSAAKLAGRCTT